MSGLVPGILLGLAMMAVVKMYSKKKNFPKCERVPAKDALRLVYQSMPALLTPIILIGGICQHVCAAGGAVLLPDH